MKLEFLFQQEQPRCCCSWLYEVYLTEAFNQYITNAQQQVEVSQTASCTNKAHFSVHTNGFCSVCTFCKCCVYA